MNEEAQHEAESGLVMNGGVATGDVISSYLEALTEHIALKGELTAALSDFWSESES